MTETPNNKLESYEDRAEADLISYVKENSFTTEEVKGSYFHSCGMTDGEAAIYNQELSDKMKELTSEGFPLNRFADLVTKLQEADQILVEFDSVVEKLSVSDNEKRVLTSIVKEGRKGELEFLVDGKEILGVDIDAVFSPEVTAAHLLEVVLAVTEKIGEQKRGLSIQFSEE